MAVSPIPPGCHAVTPHLVLRNTAAAPAEASEVRQAHREAQAPPLIATVRSAIAAEPARWGWQRDGGTVQDISDAVYAWLAQLDSAAGTAWQPRAARDTTAPAPLGPELKLLRDGRVMHSLRLTERGVLWEHGQSSWQAALPLSTLQALERSAP